MTLLSENFEKDKNHHMFSIENLVYVISHGVDTQFSWHRKQRKKERKKQTNNPTNKQQNKDKNKIKNKTKQTENKRTSKQTKQTNKRTKKYHGFLRSEGVGVIFEITFHLHHTSQQVFENCPWVESIVTINLFQDL